jgi:hypothetical protein
MSTGLYNSSDYKVTNRELDILINKLRSGIWNCGIFAWLFGIVDRSFAAFADGYLSAIELTQIFIAAFLFIAWLYLQPEADKSERLNLESVDTLKYYKLDANPNQHQDYLEKTQARMLQLSPHHMISQAYVLPVPYLCQIYHLLNLKHLESIHNFSLNNLKIIDVSNTQSTEIGGAIKFKTVLDSPMNALRIWRQPVVEVELILHNPYTVELSIPVYSGKRIIVMFNVLPLGDDSHKLFIDIYSNLVFPKPILQILLHIASCLTLFEDLPYLHKLAERNVHRLVKFGKTSNHKTMWLFKRFVDLYGSSLEQASIEGYSLHPALEVG